MSFSYEQLVQYADITEAGLSSFAFELLFLICSWSAPSLHLAYSVTCSGVLSVNLQYPWSSLTPTWYLCWCAYPSYCWDHTLFEQYLATVLGLCKFLYGANPKWWNYLVCFVGFYKPEPEPTSSKPEGYASWSSITPINKIYKCGCKIHSRYLILYVCYEYSAELITEHLIITAVGLLFYIESSHQSSINHPSKSGRSAWMKNLISNFVSISILTLSYLYLTSCWGAAGSALNHVSK